MAIPGDCTSARVDAVTTNVGVTASGFRGGGVGGGATTSGGGATTSGGGGVASGGGGGGSSMGPHARRLSQFLASMRCEKGRDHTHTSFAKPAGAFYIPGSHCDRFMELYVAALVAGEELHFTEHHRHIGPVVIDLDFRFEPTAEEIATRLPTRRYTPELVRTVAKIYGRAITQFVRCPSRFDIYVMEKSMPSMQKGLVKDGVHIMMPDIVTRPEVQLIVRQNILSQLSDVFRQHMGGTANRVEDVVDESVLHRNNWMMYGSNKPGGEPYLVTHRLSYDTATGHVTVRVIDPVLLERGSREAVDLFSIRNNDIECEVLEERVRDIDTFVVSREERRRRHEAIGAVMGDTPNTRSNTCDDIGKVCSLVDMLNPQRTDSYNDWVRVGWCLRNIDHRLLDKWTEFSKRSPKYIDGECPKLWNIMRQGGLGIGTLHMWARQDSPERYYELLRIDLSELILKSANGTHHDVARVLHQMYRYEYVCSSIRNRTWYEYRGHRWHESDSAYTLRKRMSDEVFKEYNKIAIQMQTRAVGSDDEQEQGRLLQIVQKLNAVALQLKKTNFKDNVIKECGELFMVEKFEDLLDADCDLLGFENGVYDLQRREFRDGRPDDHISFSTGINYIPYDDANPSVVDLKRVIEQILPLPEVRCYVMRSLAACLSGHVLSERFNIWTGSGANGKSVTVSLMEKAFGDYSCKFPVTLLTQKRAASNAASSEIARAKGRRFAVLQEPSDDERLNIGLMKELSGGDKIQCRSLYKAPVEWKPQFKMFLLCNHLPSVPSEDGGTWRRIRVVEFGSKFVENPTRDNEYPIDVELPQKMDPWKEHFMAMLIDYHCRFAHCANIDEPDAVTACTREYQRSNDHMADFMDSCIVRVADPSALFTVSEALEEYKSWAKTENLANAKTPNRRELQAYLDRALVPHVYVKGNIACFRGFRLRSKCAEFDDTDDALESGFPRATQSSSSSCTRPQL